MIRFNKKLKEEIRELKSKADAIVKCMECKHLIFREDCQVVKSFDYGVRQLDEFYCPEHKQPFDIKYYEEIGNGSILGGGYITKTHYYKTTPEQKIEVDEKGKEINKK